MLEIILTLFLMLLVYLGYVIYKPYRLMKNYTKQLQALGYKVLMMPYRPL